MCVSGLSLCKLCQTWPIWCGKRVFRNSVFWEQSSATGLVNGLDQGRSDIHNSLSMYLNPSYICTMSIMINMEKSVFRKKIHYYFRNMCVSEIHCVWKIWHNCSQSQVIMNMPDNLVFNRNTKDTEWFHCFWSIVTVLMFVLYDKM